MNNAGVLDGGSIDQTDEDLFDKVFGVNANGAFFVTRHALTRIPDGGRIIFLLSLAWRMPFPQYLAYSMTKGSLNTLTMALAAHLRPRGITLNAIAPGPIRTETSARLACEE